MDMSDSLLRASPGDPATGLPPLESRTLSEMIARATRRFSGQTAFECMGARLTYAELSRASEAFAAYLQKHLGLQKGERVAVMMPNMLANPVALFGVLRAGLIVVSVNPLYTPRELEHQLNDSGAVAIVLFEGAGRVLEAVIERTAVRHVILASIGDMMPRFKAAMVDLVVRRVKKMVKSFRLPKAVRFGEALALGRTARLDEPALADTDIAFLQYTGGTTGVSKGAALTHRNLLANLAQIGAVREGFFREGKEVTLAILPMYHIGGLSTVLYPHGIGARIVLVPNPRDLPSLIEVMARSRFTVMIGVNTLFNVLTQHPDIGKVNFSGMRLSAGSAAAIQAPVAERWQRLTGKALVEGWGMTETAGLATACPWDSTAFSGTVGLPLPGNEIQIRDAGGEVLPPGEAGQVFVRGPGVMAGYWQKPAETAAVLGQDGFLATGDVGVLGVDGMLRIVDRLKDMILVSGFNVYPNEIEEVLAQCPGVLEAAAIGVPSAESGESVKAFVVKTAPALTAAAVQAHCRAYLTAYKVPREVEFVASLPKSLVGKVLRRELRQSAG